MVNRVDRFNQIPRDLDEQTNEIIDDLSYCGVPTKFGFVDKIGVLDMIPKASDPSMKERPLVSYFHRKEKAVLSLCCRAIHAVLVLCGSNGAGVKSFGEIIRKVHDLNRFLHTQNDRKRIEKKKRQDVLKQFLRRNRSSAC